MSIEVAAELPPVLADLRDEVEERLQQQLSLVERRLVDLHPSLAPLSEGLTAFVGAGGKRLRPLLLLVGWRAAGGGDVAPALGPALALELLHTCALVHDDIIDAATTRRGQPAAHVRFRSHHEQADWAGDAGAFGTAAALLLGDLAFVVSDALFLQAAGAVPAGHLVAAFARFTTMREEVTAGQYLDVVAAHSGSTSVDLALAVATLKSARYSVSRPLELGALLAAGEGEVASGLADAGVPLGQAFQLRDDVLGVFGSEAQTGKSTRSDLAEGKRTVLVALTAQRLDAAERARFEELLLRRDLDEDQAEELRRTMRASGGLAATEERIAALVAEADARLAAIALPDRERRLLRELAGYLVERTA